MMADAGRPVDICLACVSRNLNCNKMGTDLESALQNSGWVQPFVHHFFAVAKARVMLVAGALLCFGGSMYSVYARALFLSSMRADPRWHHQFDMYNIVQASLSSMTKPMPNELLHHCGSAPLPQRRTTVYISMGQAMRDCACMGGKLRMKCPDARLR